MSGQLRSRTLKHKALSLAILLFVALAALGLAAGTGARPVAAQDAPFTLGSAVATTTGLNLRDQPSAGGATVATLPVNARLIVLGGPFNDSWYWLDYSGTRGYANGKYLVVVDEKWTPVSTETPTAQSTPTSASTRSTTPSAPSPVSTAPAGTATRPANGTPTDTPMPDYTAPTTPGDYTNLWLGQMSIGGNVRSGPSIKSSIVKGWWAGRRVLLYQSATDEKGATWYRVSEPPEAPMWVHSSLIVRVAPVKFEPARFRGKWVNVNISQQIVTAYENGKPVMVTLASTGKGKNETELGTWKIYWRLPKQTMEGGNKASGDYYKLKDVPFPQYFHTSGEALHGTFWHDNFGYPMSHGCVNLSTPIAGWLYGWASIGTTVYVHN